MLTFEEWRHTYADIFETDDAARAAWTAASNKGYSAGVQDTRELLAAHSAGGAQEPVAWAVYNGWCKIAFYMSEEGARDHVGAAQRSHDLSGSLAAFRAVPLYTHPQPMPQTDAARDVLVRAKRMLEGYADSYKRMGQDSTSRGGDGRITCTAIMYDIRDNMAGWCDAEIERLDRAKGE